ncbi:hypothetical protein X275_00370 [Marinitoga sp. 1197]|uniref:ATP-binding response regulator n=1 Tax=Marinitoga sp. 1197 TaxID=1428449 RepID=UPI0006417CC7|nr:hybrid sensor histidine kinase/response regulator [Marinitoga sp. 1197]KLO24284.1 hypothetical protein X275_00370 [Marinitoga sp. 1197]
MKNIKFSTFFDIFLIIVFFIFLTISSISSKISLNILINNEIKKGEKLMELTEISVKDLINRWIDIFAIDLYTTPEFLNLKLQKADAVKSAYVFDNNFIITEIIKQDEKYLKKGFSVNYLKDICQNMLVNEYKILPFTFSVFSFSPAIAIVLKYSNDSYYIWILNDEFIKKEILKFVPEKTYVLFSIKDTVFLNTTPIDFSMINNEQDIKKILGNQYIITNRYFKIFDANIYYITSLKYIKDKLGLLNKYIRYITLFLLISFVLIFLLKREFISEMSAVLNWGSKWKPENDIKISKKTFYENIQISESFKNLMSRVNETIKELKETQEELIQSQKLETIGIMAGGFAHDFNNILAVLKTEVEMMKESQDFDEINESIQNIELAIKRAKNIIKQMLVFSKKGKTKYEYFNFKEFINSTFKLIKKGVPLNINLVLNNSINEDISIYGNSNQLMQVLLNIITNARDAVKSVEKPKIEINTSIIKNNEDAFLQIEIKDNGAGIPDEIRDKIFDPFFTTKGKGGTGLGLTIVSKIIKDHNGNIKIFSKFNEGTNFVITLPIQYKDKPLKNTKEKLKKSKIQSFKVLIVDDEKRLRKNIKKYLNKKKFKIIEASSVDEAIEIIKKDNEIDYIITDYMMPEKTGDYLVNFINQYNKDIKITVITGYLSDEVEKKLKKYNVKIILKPFEFEELLSIFDEY